ncbi:hypothetical protein [Morganella morganii]|uniref:hypothetical protein n=1 Tax=Morganella morganii TaxID=582 RepID=UPI00259EDB78|nr:hypothetical protein [Morganella morganii]ELL8928671.1 hypothetical protein [Morganella morganii]
MLKITSHEKYAIQDFSGHGLTEISNVKSITGYSEEIDKVLQHINQNKYFETYPFFYTINATGNEQVAAQIELAFFGQYIIDLDINEFVQKLNIPAENYTIG